MLKRFLKKNSTPETDVASVVQALDAKSAQIVDVREHNEWNEGHIPGAIHIPLGELPARLTELDSQRPVITVCRSGRRSLKAAEQLLAGGFQDAKSLAGGMIDWTKSGQRVER